MAETAAGAQVKMMRRFVKYALVVCVAVVQYAAQALGFSAAKPVWPEGREKEWNCQAGFTAEFTGAATPESHPELWKRLVEDFGPKRKTDNK